MVAASLVTIETIIMKRERRKSDFEKEVHCDEKEVHCVEKDVK